MTSAATAATSIVPRVHILGAGNIGCLIAHSLRGLKHPPQISLLLHRPHTASIFGRKHRTIRVNRDGVTIVHRGFGIEITDPASIDAAMLPSPNPIKSLIVATKAHHTVKALSYVRDRLSRDSTIVFVQNGMGVLDEFNKNLFPDESNRPNIVLGITTHGAHSSQPFDITHAGWGTIDLGVVPRDLSTNPNVPIVEPDLETYEASTRDLLRQLLQCHDLGYSVAPYPEILSRQLEKLVINAVINALTVMFNCYNGQLLYNFHISRIMRLIIFEASKVVAAMPELDSVPSREIRFAPERLERLVVATMKSTSVNISSMLQDVRAGRETEVDYINGFIVSKGAELGIPCAVNFALREMVNGRLKMERVEIKKGDLPMEGDIADT